MKEKQKPNTHWHGYFVGSMHLELCACRDYLEYQQELPLGTGAPILDLLIIKKQADIAIENEIGQIFRGHNLVEYKSPNDRLDLRVFLKTVAYAGLYVGSDAVDSGAKPKDTTITFVRSRKPVKLMKELEKYYHYEVSNAYPGIYYVIGGVLFPTQIVVTEELSTGNHVWLKAIGGKEPDNETYRLIAEKKEQINTQETAHAVEIMRFLHNRYKDSFEQFYKEESVMARTLEDFANELAEMHIKRLEEENSQYRSELDQYRQENDQYRQRIADLEAMLTLK